ncbi:hypothetical protein [Paenibacillus sp. HB172176]|uniref:hypothetical protein n=1 Tax=Paenibacillus sp. HB172176 TaxID=2493690 RepID=UPI00143B9737|nr:hypothetical protein [Paenibacillus sp. HB172176]
MKKQKNTVWIILVILIISGIYNYSDKSKSDPNETIAEQDSSNETQKSNSIEDNGSISKNTNYEVVYTISNERFDKGTNLYVLLNPVNLDEPTKLFSDIKLIINKLIKEYEPKTSIDFFDKKEVLDLEYKLYGDLSLGRNTTPEENKERELHIIAGFSGDLTTDLYLNTLYLFPSADSSTPKVGKYVSIEEYNPEK